MGLAGGGAISMTLMACYGAPCVNDDCRYDPDASGDASRDARADGASDGGTDASADAPDKD